MPQNPGILYHGSSAVIHGPLEPRPARDDVNGAFPEGTRNVIFATDDRNLAVVYALKTPQMLAAGESNGVCYGILRDYDDWRKTLASSTPNVYVLPSDTFTNTLNKKTGQHTSEWTSSVPVMPLQAIHYTPEDVMQTGAQLFFLAPIVDKELWGYDPDKGPADTLMNRLIAKHKSGVLPPTFSELNLARELWI